MHETFEHTADLGLRIRAADLDTLFVEAAQALFETIVPDLASVRPQKKVEIALTGDDRAYLLFDWLKELLFHFDAEHLLLGKFEAHVRDDGLTGAAWGEHVDRSRHVLEHEVKAITYHGLRVEQTPTAWKAEVIIDIQEIVVMNSNLSGVLWNSLLLGAFGLMLMSFGLYMTISRSSLDPTPNMIAGMIAVFSGILGQQIWQELRTHKRRLDVIEKAVLEKSAD